MPNNRANTWEIESSGPSIVRSKVDTPIQPKPAKNPYNTPVLQVLGTVAELSMGGVGSQTEGILKLSLTKKP